MELLLTIVRRTNLMGRRPFLARMEHRVTTAVLALSEHAVD